MKILEYIGLDLSRHKAQYRKVAEAIARDDFRSAEVKKLVPSFTMDYKVDPVRQAIAESWPNYMDDSAARQEWGWRPAYDLPAMAKDMIEVLSKKLAA